MKYKKYYERMGDEATIIKKQLVDSIPATANPATFKQVGLMFALILVVGLLFMSLAGTSVWGEAAGGQWITNTNRKLMRYWYKPIAVILSINLVIPQVNVEKSEQKTGLVNVAYVGESMENIPESYQKLVLSKNVKSC
ncbi:MAG: hypothetical protein Ct9H300mP18_13460 [Candidatus Neomarinimicrobiota bacterium]|nr:MAG: hypothetical protein Ct9H300mP18_13460 [Candidatus Neomarinimicrobiota bacterium]